MSLRIFTAVSMLLLSACSSLSQKECTLADWHQQGYQQGAKGYQYSRGLDIISSCREYGISPDIDAYQDGHYQGVQQYCQPENGFSLGLSGNDYNSICNSRAFREAWEKGHDRYLTSKRLEEIDYRVDDIQKRLKDISREISSSTLTDTQRSELRIERRRLEDELDDLRKERLLVPIISTLPEVDVEYKF